MSKLNLNTIQIETSKEEDANIKSVVEFKDTIESLVKECFKIDVEKKKLENKLKIKKDKLKVMIDTFGIDKIKTENFTMTRVSSRRFKGWDKENTLVAMIPKKLRGLDTMVPDRSKIEALVKSHEIPEMALEFQIFTVIDSIKFMPAVEKIQTD